MDREHLRKSERLRQIEEYLLAHPQGVSRAELARHFSVNRSTIGRDIDDLGEVPIIEDDRHILSIDRSSYLHHVRLNIHEIQSIALAYQLLAANVRFSYPHAGRALIKLSVAIERMSPVLGRQLNTIADFPDSCDYPSFTTGYLAHLEKITLAIAERKKLAISYHSPKKKTGKDYLVSPHCLEPNADGRSIYLVGFLDCGGLRMFKLERIKELAATEMDCPDNLDYQREDRLSNAWNIWGKEDGKTVTVRLKFSERVASRVNETVWLKGQSTEKQNDGSLLWSAEVAEPLEMYPWIRGWGCDVEILQPVELRERFREEVKELGRVYG